jgi:drug/metabolite transporter (DMT)-like permease
MTIIVAGFFVYKLSTEKHFHKFHNYKKLKASHYGASALICMLTVLSAVLIYEYDKNYNTPFLNSLFTKVASIVCLFLAGVLVFKEKYTWKQIAGIIVILFGIYLVAGSGNIGI